MDKLKALFSKSDRPPAPEPLPDRTPDVTPEQRQVPSSYTDIPERVLIHTTLGDITVGLFREQTPKVSGIVFMIVVINGMGTNHPTKYSQFIPLPPTLQTTLRKFSNPFPKEK